MFHTYVQGFKGCVIDLNHAQWIMNRDLALQAIDYVEKEWPRLQQQGADCRDQAFYDRYVTLHREHYGEPFEPDVNPDWDCSPRARQARRQEREKARSADTFGSAKV